MRFGTARRRGALRARIAQVLGLAPQQVNVKAKTAEKMGPVGEGRSIEARAVVLLAADVPRLLAVGQMASSGHASTLDPSTSGRAGVDWAAAGRKSWETRRRNAKSRA